MVFMLRAIDPSFVRRTTRVEIPLWIGNVLLTKEGSIALHVT
jgi:hypothetical protein